MVESVRRGQSQEGFKETKDRRRTKVNVPKFVEKGAKGWGEGIYHRRKLSYHKLS